MEEEEDDDDDEHEHLQSALPPIPQHLACQLAEGLKKARSRRIEA
jgi:hypothetical protein